MSKDARILSFDISASPGAAVIEVKKGIPKLISVNHAVTSSGHTDAQRYAYVKAFVTQFVHDNGPYDYIVREKFIKGGSKRGTQLVFGSWAAIDEALAIYGYAIDDKDEIVASSVKKAIGGKGNAQKDEVAEGVIKMLGEKERAKFFTERGRLLDDRADAVAIGLTYAMQKGIIV